MHPCIPVENVQYGPILQNTNQRFFETLLGIGEHFAPLGKLSETNLLVHMNCPTLHDCGHCCPHLSLCNDLGAKARG